MIITYILLFVGIFSIDSGAGKLFHTDKKSKTQFLSVFLTKQGSIQYRQKSKNPTFVGTRLLSEQVLVNESDYLGYVIENVVFKC